MSDLNFWDFIMDGGDELLNSELCFHCGNVIYLDQKIEWIDRDKKIAKCPSCGREVRIGE